jgi:hypothetical protein
VQLGPDWQVYSAMFPTVRRYGLAALTKECVERVRHSTASRPQCYSSHFQADNLPEINLHSWLRARLEHVHAELLGT